MCDSDGDGFDFDGGEALGEAIVGLCEVAGGNPKGCLAAVVLLVMFAILIYLASL
jgi:hypothetical protein